MRRISSIIIFNITLFMTGSMYGQQLISVSPESDCQLANMKEINTPEFEFSPCFYGEGIAFVYSVQKQNKSIFDKSINTSFFDLGFYFPDNSEFPFDSTQKMFRFDEELNSDFHEGPLCFHEDKVCYFTREDADYKKSKKRNGKAVLQILVTRNHRNNWSPSEVLPFCDKKYNFCHPTISSDGKTMIFASDKPGGYGKMDLYLTTKDEKNKWSEPYNLGSTINSTSNDWFPFLYRDSLLFFASNKIGGKGGLDIYASGKQMNNWSEAEILPEPFNGTQDDFGFILRDNGKDGYFSSARPGGRGNDDIYRFITNSSILFGDSKAEFMFTIVDSITDNSLAGVKMNYIPIKTEDRVFDIEHYDINLLKSKNEGNFLLELSPKDDGKQTIIESNNFGKLWGVLNNDIPYVLTFTKEGYQPYSMIYDASKSKKDLSITLIKEIPNRRTHPTTVDASKYIHSRDNDLYIPTTKGSKVTLNNIYYDSNKSNILPGAAKELDALFDIMNNNEEVRIMLNAHTDAIGKSSYNLILSQERADAARNYLIRKGINRDRIIAIGMGESEILNHCKNGVQCSEKEHRINRRTEVEIL